MTHTNNAELIEKLNISFQTAMASGVFTGDEKSIKKAIEALEIPDPEARVKAQLRINAEKALSLKAAAEFKKTGTFVPPSDDEIEAYIADGLEKFRKKQARL